MHNCYIHVAATTELHPHLKPGLVPGRVEVGGAEEVPKLDLVACLVGANVHGELHFQELVGLLPFHL